MPYHDLTHHDRYVISHMTMAGFSQAEIARRLDACVGCNVCCVSGEQGGDESKMIVFMRVSSRDKSIVQWDRAHRSSATVCF